MGFRKTLLYRGYKIAKKLGFVSLINSVFNRASILIYHRVNNQEQARLSISTALFEEMVENMAKKYNIISLESLIERLNEKKEIPNRAVVITFDDGYRDNYLYGARILKKYNLTATFFVTSGYIGSDRNFPWDTEVEEKRSIMDWDEVRELSRMGFEIGGHTVNHVDLGKVSLGVAEKEIRECKDKIEDEIGQEINKFAYPFGGKDAIRPEVIEIIKNTGYICCCSGYGGKVRSGGDPFRLHRISMYRNLTDLLMELDNFHTYFNGRMKFGPWNENNAKG